MVLLSLIDKIELPLLESKSARLMTAKGSRIYLPGCIACFSGENPLLLNPLVQGVRIDYVLASPGLLPKMGKVEIVSASSIPEKWSDHAALRVTVRDISPPEPHPAIPESSKRMKKFDTRSQPTIASMFARKASSKDQKEQIASAGTEPAKASKEQQSGKGDLFVNEKSRL